MLDDNFERFLALVEPLPLPGPVIVVDTEDQVDVAAIAAGVRSALGRLT